MNYVCESIFKIKINWSIYKEKNTLQARSIDFLWNGSCARRWDHKKLSSSKTHTGRGQLQKLGLIEFCKALSANPGNRIQNGFCFQIWIANPIKKSRDSQSYCILYLSLCWFACSISYICRRVRVQWTWYQSDSGCIGQLNSGPIWIKEALNPFGILLLSIYIAFAYYFCYKKCRRRNRDEAWIKLQ